MKIEYAEEMHRYIEQGYTLDIEKSKEQVSLLFANGGDKIFLYFRDDNLWARRFKKGDLLHRPSELGPACEYFLTNGNISERNYYNLDRRHRPVEDGPALEVWWDNGLKLREEYIEYGLTHRPLSDGPAISRWGPDGDLVFCHYYLDGIRWDISTNAPYHA